MIRRFPLVVLLVLLGVPIRARAASEFRGFVKAEESLYSGPGASYGPVGGERTKPGEELLVLGSSVGGAWTLVLREDGSEGWVPTSRLDLVRVTPSELDRFQLTVDRKRRLTSRWIGNVGPLGGTGPLGFGAGVTLYANLARNGFATFKSDQLELGVGFNLYTGQVAYNAKTDTVVSKRSFSEIPISLLWLGRFGPRGAFMIGSRLGVSVMSDPTFPAGRRALPFTVGVQMRYYPDDVYGFYSEGTAIIRSVQYVAFSTGMSFRF